MTFRRQESHSSEDQLTDPGQIMANFPGLFGFYPQESIVLCTLTSTGGTSLRLGPVLRLDLGDLLSVRALADPAGPLMEADFVAGFLVGEGLLGVTPDDPRIVASLSALRAAVDEAGVDLLGCWSCNRVITGEGYRLLWPPRSGRAVGPWDSGQIGDVTQAPAMLAWHATGELPELTRTETFQRFAVGNPQISAEECALIQEYGEDIAAGRAGEESEDLWLATSSVLTLGEEIAAVERCLSSVDDLWEDDQLLTCCATVLATARLRDAAVVDVLEHPAAAARVMLVAAKSLRGELRANALCLCALAMIQQGLPMFAIPAVTTAQEEVPGHTLAALIYDATQLGAFDALLTGAHRGGEMARRHLSL